MTQTTENHLAESTSPYLLQHAENPVAWWPWCDEALQLARDQNRPILLSIGYSACHWCHVMAHESFEDEDTAALMNALYVNIKVDREERPDIDKIYQTAHQLLSQRLGGWPLTVFLTPNDLNPFFAGTYFPNTPRHGLPAFKDLLQQIHQASLDQATEIQQQNQSLQRALEQTNPTTDPGQRLDASPISLAYQQLVEDFDQIQGGFGQAPKFPHVTNLDFLLRRSLKQDDQKPMEMVSLTLAKMALGGINDQLGGGFCRYSVDDFWTIPHFEKMLYDNGPLLSLYADAWLATGNPIFKETCEQTATWVIREMQSAEGGYYSSLDADSEGEEGRFYVWDRAEIKALLNRDEFQALSRRFGLDARPNFEGRWNLHTAESLDTVVASYADDQQQAELRSARQKLLAARDGRIRPGTDHKILTSWNALMIKGMAKAGRILGIPAWTASAEQALGFIRTHLWRDDRLLATSHPDPSDKESFRPRLNAYLDDYAFLLDALLELLQTRWRSDDLYFATQLADVLLKHFQDQQQGGFFFTADDHEKLIHRPRPYSDDSMASGNGVAAFALQRLGYLTGNQDYISAAERTIQSAWSPLQRQASAHCALLIALEESIQPIELLIIRGEGMDLLEWQRQAQSAYRPRSCVFAIPTGADHLPEALADKAPIQGTVAYPCEGTSCLPAIRDIAGLKLTP